MKIQKYVYIKIFSKKRLQFIIESKSKSKECSFSDFFIYQYYNLWYELNGRIKVFELVNETCSINKG